MKYVKWNVINTHMIHIGADSYYFTDGDGAAGGSDSLGRMSSRGAHIEVSWAAPRPY